uniref:SAM domain-containing protein n=1 Tax=Ciona savignyi TaxID=51511 RepID=H2Y9Y1_CIOSA
NLEQLMVTVLDERDKLVENLQEVKENLANTNAKLDEVEKERQFLLKQLNTSMPPDYASLTKELNHARERILECTEEIDDMKSERNNTRPSDLVLFFCYILKETNQIGFQLLLEHLETLVARHERSLRMTVVKRQQQQNAGVSSEVEVLKALKSLFEHHKALDEKVREKLKAALEREMHLEELLESSSRETKVLREQVNQLKLQNQNGSDESLKKSNNIKPLTTSDGLVHISVKYLNQNVCFKMTNGNCELEEEANRIVLLQETNDKQAAELIHVRQRVNTMLSRTAELEESLQVARKDLMKSEELNNRTQKEYRDVNKSRLEIDERVTTLERRYLNAQREAASVHELNDRLEAELANRDAAVRQLEERNDILQDRIKSADQKLQQSLRRAEALPEVEAELAQRVAALTKAEERHGNVEERLKSMESKLEEKTQELLRARQREKMNEEHNQRLSSTVDRLLAESNERLQLHLKEKMASLEEKVVLFNSLSSDFEKVKKLLEDSVLDKERLQRSMDKLHSELNIYKASKVLFYFANCLLIFLILKLFTKKYKNIIPGSKLHVEYHSHHAVTHCAEHAESYREHTGSHASSSDLSFLCISRPCHLRPLCGCGCEQCTSLCYIQWERAQQADILSQVQKAFEGSSASLQPSICNPTASAVDLLSPVGQTDAHSLAHMLQDQLDAINQEISILQEEKVSTERRAEEIEHRVSEPRRPINTLLSIKGGLVVSMLGSTFSFSKDSSFSNPSPCFHCLEGDMRTPDVKLLSAALDLLSSLLCNMFLMSWLSFVKRTSLWEGKSGRFLSLSLQESVQKGTSSPVSNITSKKKSVIKSSIGRLFGKKDKVVNLSQYKRLGRLGSDMKCWKKLDDVGLHLLPGMDQPSWLGWSFFFYPLSFLTLNMQLWVGMPAWYVAACRANVKSGAIMSALSDTEIQREIGISNPLHRLKLRLAIHEMISLTSPSAPPTSRTTTGSVWMTHEEVDSLANQVPLTVFMNTINTLAYGDMNHEWIGNEWLPSLGLAQYRSHFMECLVDARMLDHLTKKDLRQHLKMVDGFHRSSLQFGILCLKRLNYNKKDLEQRREQSADEIRDVQVWSNQRVIRWLQGVGLRDYATRLSDSGIHGAVVALDNTFDAEAFALVLQIPNQNTQARQILEREFSNLVALGTERQLEPDEPDSKNFRRNPSWRK